MRTTLLALAATALLAGCANKTASTACTGITDTLSSPCVYAANLCQGILHLPCYAVPMPSPEPTVVP